MSTTITAIADRITTELDLTPDAALEAAASYWTQIRFVDDDEQIDPATVTPSQEVSDEDADFIVESARRQLAAEGLL